MTLTQKNSVFDNFFAYTHRARWLTAMQGQAISNGCALWPCSRELGGSDRVSVDTCPVLREPHPPACPLADLGCLTCEQGLRRSNALGEQQVQAGGQIQPYFSVD